MNSQTQQAYHERMLKVLVYIQQHLDEALSLEDLAGVAHFSPYHFHRIFRGMVGESVKAHVRRLRLERAAQQLKHSNEPVTRIAFAAGYETHEAFTRAFGAMFDEPPARFRESQRPLPYPATPSGVHYDPDAGPADFTTPRTGEHPMEVTIRQNPPLRVAFVRHVGPYNEVGQTWQKLMMWAGPRGLCGPNLRCLGLCHDDPEITPPDKIRYDACFVVGDDVQAEGEVGIQTVAGGDYAVTVHHGPYEKLIETYARLCGEWLPQSGRELASAPGYEIYLNNPQMTPPEKLATEIHMPLKPLGGS